MGLQGKTRASNNSSFGQATSTGNRKQNQSSSATKNLQQKKTRFVTQKEPSTDTTTKRRTVSFQKYKHVGNLSLKGHGVKQDKKKVENNSPRKESSPCKQKQQKQQQKPQSIFITPPCNFNEIVADVIHADCYNHGYRIEKTIGEGAYAKVKLAEALPSKLARLPDMDSHIDHEGNLKVAIKVIEAKNVPKEFVQKFLPRELENHCPMPPHQNVVRVFEQFRSTDRFYVVMEYCNQGDLLDLINGRISESCKGLGEDRARSLFRMLTEGMHHIHTNGIVHRDLKCENVLLDKELNLKITDFGFSTRFVPGQSSLLKTSCGSYAYTAPEVIKQKPYDGTKSDIWSLGIILFAMLNGRLPFNDAQLADLEEDQKMQRLRFERSVSFESMVLVRRILQYNPTNRPSTAVILSDPWLTGKRLIPRQSAKSIKPKWTNSYQPHPPDKDGADKIELSGNPVYYKSTVPERGSEATVTVNHEKNETVTLKSRKGNKKNIWITGPTERPKTWPRTNKPTEQQTTNKTAARGKYRGASAGTRKSRTAVVANPSESKKNPTENELKARVSTKVIHLSKWFMEKYMAGNEASKDLSDPNNCRCCKAEAACSNTMLDDLDLEEEELSFLDNGDTVESSSPDEDFRFPSPVKNMPTLEKSERDLKNPDKDVNKVNAGNVRKTSAVERKPPVKSAISIRSSTPMPKSAKSTTSTEISRKKQEKSQSAKSTTSTEICRKSYIASYMNRSTSPAERAKYVRNRLMKMYANDKVVIQADGANELPPLLIQSLNSTSNSTSPISVKSATKEASTSPPCGFTATRHSGTGACGWRPQHQRISNSVKPKKIMMLHSTAL
ncbi:serine/threonine-protein kinase MARK1-like isoform X2 [Ruditapes philippinarum]|uniref:serine/threonine-protein kinase MARK1-like isoform X2 n=1 Tax=Ruditapes philippinarum TaxID=129788 RepID=UPI00295A60AF|nr:serine/threonine-protein kinase MARK1-like isoform X2 [Ruditapes philippinarum]